MSNRHPHNWAILPLREITEQFLNGGTPSTSVPEYWNGAIPWITGADAEQRIATAARKYITERGVRESSTNIVPKGNILLVTRTGVGKVSIAGVDIAISQDLTGVIPKQELVDVAYLYRQLKYLGPELQRLSQGTIILGIQREEVEALQIPLPPLSEQRRIAEILDAADEAVRQAERLIAKLRAAKAGLLHDLLTRGLDEHGHLRDPQAHPEQFRDSPLGRIPREWKISMVDAEFQLATGFTLGPHRRPKKNKRRYLRVANVLREKILLDDITELEASDEEMANRVLHENDLLIVEGHANPDEIGRCARVPKEAVGLTFQNHLFRLRSRDLDPRFTLAWLNSEWVRARWRCLCGTSSGLNTINRTMLRAVPVPVPEKPEQQCIAAILDTHDVRIRAEEMELAKLRQVKRGLMDDLLTGQVRVGG